ncbi:nitroreductase [Anaerocolumna cellulosilytica]|uniref:Nitroreductase n=1 Tax=Anaerocolumna cellulosilytica TaxID=433286 RepID=A0A6S6R9X6_9FIRM|nr:nitroreductase family protein [Anaerocolumna cellulosilytica]MBB5195091.1 nitroreductase [Anaerocolumna cellulosilytica]BCJ96072.1 nitroreductase [Anaerocolumna cellulosilytica]
MMQELVKKTRSYRRFYGEKTITKEQLESLIALARLAPSGANRQPLKYILVHTKEYNDLIFDHIGWAGYLKEWVGPPAEERPTAYIVMLRDTTINKVQTMDEGIAAQTIFLGASALGLGGCFIGSFKKEEIRQGLGIDEQYEIAVIIALGHPKEEVVVEELSKDNDVKYWRDANQVHHVPKRKLEDIIVKEL